MPPPRRPPGKRPHTPEPVVPLAEDALAVSITMLGAGQEVGRSCCVIQHRGRTVVCDAGIDPGAHGLPSLPFVDELDWSTVDVLLVTHAHLDHAGGLAYIMEKTNFRDGPGKVYMTHATKGIYRYIMQDFIRVRSRSGGADDALFSESDVLASISSIQTVDYHQSIHLPGGIIFTPYHAGHILGAAMFMISIAGVRILYTGDISREVDRHLVPAEIPLERPDVVIGESTFGTMALEGRRDKEERLLSEVTKIVRRGGRCLLPVFVAGSAVELLLILDEYWARHPDLHAIPIYYGSHLARQCMEVYKQYIHSMNGAIRATFSRHENPFQFRHISHLRDVNKWKDGGPCVMLASPGLLHAGPSRMLLEKWAPESKNGLILTGYSTSGSMARFITDKTGLEEIEGMNGHKVPLRMSIETVSFAQHVDGTQNTEFLEQIAADHVVLVHGERHQMANLRNQLEKNAKHHGRDVKVHSPRNTEQLDIVLRTEHMAQAIGKLAARPPSDTQLVSGLLVSKDFSYTLLDPADLKNFTGLESSTIVQRQKVAIDVGWELVLWHLEGMFGSVTQGVDKEERPTIRVMNAVDLKLTAEREVTLEWIASSSNDMIADAALSLVLQIESSKASVRLTTKKHRHSHHHHHHSYDAEPASSSDPSASAAHSSSGIDVHRLLPFLTAHFGAAELTSRSPSSVRPLDVPQTADQLPTDPSEAVDPLLNAPKGPRADRQKDAPKAPRADREKAAAAAAAAAEAENVKTETMEAQIDEVLAEIPSATQPAGAETVIEGVEGLVANVPEPEDDKRRPVIVVAVDGEEAIIDLLTLTTSCDPNPSFAQKVHAVLAVAIATTTPLFMAGAVDRPPLEDGLEPESLYDESPTEAKMEVDMDGAVSVKTDPELGTS